LTQKQEDFGHKNNGGTMINRVFESNGVKVIIEAESLDAIRQNSQIFSKAVAEAGDCSCRVEIKWDNRPTPEEVWDQLHRVAGLR